jgi:hypothetical protein
LTGAIPLAGLPPGMYTLALTTRDARGREVLREVGFEVRD